MKLYVSVNMPIMLASIEAAKKLGINGNNIFVKAVVESHTEALAYATKIVSEYEEKGLKFFSVMVRTSMDPFK